MLKKEEDQKINQLKNIIDKEDNMKNLILLFILIILIGCDERDINKSNLKYKIGDEIYIKPDSTIAYISDTSRYNLVYRIGYIDKNGIINFETIDEFAIYGKK